MKQFCDEFGVSKQEALFRSKTFPSPSLMFKSSPGNEKSASETPSTQPLMTDSRPSSNHPQNPSEEQSINQKIVTFCECVCGATVEDAKYYLSLKNWDLNLAVNYLMGEGHPTFSERSSNSQIRRSNSQPFSNDGRTISQSSLQMSSGDERSNFMQEIMTRTTQFRNSSSPSSSTSMESDPTETFNEAEGPPSSMRSTSLPNSPEQLSPLKEKSIKEFLEVATGASPQVAKTCLGYFKWNLDDALIFFFEHGTDAVREIATAEVDIQNIPESGNPTQTREEHSWPPTNVWVDQICDAAGVSREEALFYLEGFKCIFDKAMEACRSKTLPPFKETSSLGVSVSEESAEEPPSPVREQLMGSFQETAVGATREEANTYLKQFKWDVNQAICFFLDYGSPVEEIHALDMSMTENRDLPLPSMGFPSQPQFQASYGSQNHGYLKEGKSSSSTNAGPTVTQRSLEEAGEGSVTVAIPGMASSQVDGKAVEDDSSTKTFRDPFANQDRTIMGTQTAPATIIITIVLADDGSGESLVLPFRLNETVSDIRNAIDERTPDNDRDYYLQSTVGLQYMDLNITVHRISTDGSTTLLQMLLDP